MSYDRPVSRSGMKPEGDAVDTIRDHTGKDLIALDYGCYICGRIYSTPATARKHVRNIHGYNIPGRTNCLTRPMAVNHYYVSRKDANYYDVIHYACPSCWFHCPLDELDLLLDHTIIEHNPRPVMLESDEEHDMDIGTDSRICCD
ncbi:hypothetical protein BDF21DRAFT_463458 [Thamnidium elegans]|nr:hypothetical protein BDF21DRAFT_463458 [Thamnidium elegans]